MVTRPGCLRPDGTCPARGDNPCPQCVRIQRDWADKRRVRRRSLGNQARSAAIDPTRRRELILAAAAVRRPPIDAKRGELERLWRSGATTEQIAKATGYSPTSVCAIANLVGLRHSDRGGHRS